MLLFFKKKNKKHHSKEVPKNLLEAQHNLPELPKWINCLGFLEDDKSFLKHKHMHLRLPQLETGYCSGLTSLHYAAG